MQFVAGKFRQIGRILWLLVTLAGAGIDYCLRGGWRWAPLHRAHWLRSWCRFLLKGYSFSVETIGPPPKGGFVVSNHLSYMDIIVLASALPQVFLSKREVADWPVIGWYTRIAGTLFIDRNKRSDVATKEAGFSEVIESGVGMTVFLEGTSTDGTTVLPFRASLLQPVVKNEWPVTPVYLKYVCEGGDVAQDVCWWGDMGFGSHLLRLAKTRRVRATIAFGKSRVAAGDRKALAEALWRETLDLRDLVEGRTLQEPFEPLGGSSKPLDAFPAS